MAEIKEHSSGRPQRKSLAQAARQEASKRRRRALHANLALSIVMMVLTDVIIFQGFLASPTGSVGVFGIVTVLACALLQGSLLAATAMVQPTWNALLMAANMLFIVVVGFGGLYYEIGKASNWGLTLTHLDAIYVALGTLSTAGTGNIAPISETSRCLVSLQMGADIVVVVLALGVLVGRISQAAPSWLARAAERFASR